MLYAMLCGCLQDWVFCDRGSLELTLELHEQMQPPPQQLPTMWQLNKPALLRFAEMVSTDHVNHMICSLTRHFWLSYAPQQGLHCAYLNLIHTQNTASNCHYSVPPASRVPIVVPSVLPAAGSDGAACSTSRCRRLRSPSRRRACTHPAAPQTLHITDTSGEFHMLLAPDIFIIIMLPIKP
jgi:hypothetical protein